MTRKPAVTANDFQWSLLDVKKFSDWRDCHFSVALDWGLDTEHLNKEDHAKWNHLVIKLMHGDLKTNDKNKSTINQDTLKPAAILTGVIPVWAQTIDDILERWPHLKNILLGEELGQKQGDELDTALKSFCFSVTFIPDWDDLIVLILEVCMCLFHPRLG